MFPVTPLPDSALAFGHAAQPYGFVLLHPGQCRSSALDGPADASNPCDQHVQRRDDCIPAWGHVGHLLAELTLRDAGELWREYGVGIALDFQQRRQGVHRPVAQGRRWAQRRHHAGIEIAEQVASQVERQRVGGTGAWVGLR